LHFDCLGYHKAHLKQLLREDHRTIFTMIQKFGTDEKGQSFEKLSDRDDIIIITDEAHRTQYGSLAMNMREALPNAAFIISPVLNIILNKAKETAKIFEEIELNII
jgi:type I restriction enzyme, R subunit